MNLSNPFDQELPPRLTLECFKRKIEAEFLQGSAIAPEVFATAIAFIEDTGFWEPQQALGWKVATQYQTRKPHNFEALACFQNEDNSLWQAKPQNPRIDLKKGSEAKYESLVASGSRAFTPAIDVETWFRIAKKQHVEEFLPTWVRAAILEKQIGLKSNVSWVLSEAEFKNYAGRLKQISAKRYSRGISPARGFSLRTDKSISQNSQKPLNSTGERILKTLSSTLDLTQKTANIPSRLPLASSGCLETETSSQSSPLRESAPLPTPFPIETSSFWQWIELLNLSLIVTEGGKKALSLLSQGYVAIALYGVNSGVHKWDTIAGEKVRRLKPELIPDLQRFASIDRPWAIAFDQDSSLKTRNKVEGALGDLAFHLEQSGGKVSIIQWDGQNGHCKGVDDLIVKAGVEAWEKALEEAVPTAEWRISRKLAHAVRRKPDLHIGNREFKEVAAELPTSGLLALYGGKGTAKSEAIAIMLGNRTWLSVTALRSVARDQAAGFGGVFVNDGDRYGTRLLDQSGQPVKGGSVCVPSMLKVQRVEAEILVLDETTAIAEFLLISKLANKDGLRPLLLTEFIRRVRDARLVIFADADMTQEAIDWIEGIRGERSYLIRSDRQALTYEATVIDGSQNAAIAMLQLRAERLAKGKLLYINCDTKRLAETLAEVLGSQQSLLIHCDTSGEAIQSSFLASKGKEIPKLILMGIKFIISSPSVVQGFSMTHHTELIDSVWGFYSGCSITAHGMAQGLDRPRSSEVPRFIWVAHRGRAYSKLSKAQTTETFLKEFKQINTTAARLVRHSLTPDAAIAVDSIDWENQNLKMLASLEVRRNQGMMGLRHTLIALLKHEGKRVATIKPSVSRQETKAAGRSLKAVGQALKAAHYVAVANAEDLVPDQAKTFSEQTEALTPDQILSLEKFYVGEFYRLDQVATEDASFDQSGKTRAQIRNLEMVLNNGVAATRTAATINKSPECPQDWDTATVRLWILEMSGASDFIRDIYAEKIEVYDLSLVGAIADFCKAHASEFKSAFGFSNLKKVSAMQAVGVVLDWCGIKRKRKQTSENGVRVEGYEVDKAHLEKVSGIVNRRGETTAPPCTSIPIGGGAVAKTDDTFALWGTPECLQDIRESWALADSEEARWELRQIYPVEVLRRAIETCP